MLGEKVYFYINILKEKNHKKTYFRLFDCSRRYSLFTYLPSVKKKKKKKIRGGGGGGRVTFYTIMVCSWIIH